MVNGGKQELSAIVDNIILKSIETIKCVFEVTRDNQISETETVEINPRIEMNIEQNTDNANEYRITMGVSIGQEEESKFPYHVESIIRSVFEFHDIPITEHPDIIRLKCCSIMFPYVRANISSIMTCAGVSPYFLPVMNMDKLFSKEHLLWSASETKDKQN